jgi:hypothetical protein
MTRSILPTDFADHATRLPAWSGLAQTVDGDSPAEQIANLDYRVSEVPLTLADTGESITTHKAIVASSRSNPSVRKTLAVASVNYNALLPDDDGALLNAYFRRPADAIGVMGNGIGLWALYTLGRLYVHDDASEINLLYVSPKNAQGAVMVRLQPLRIICSNAIVMSGRTALDTFRAVHDSYVKERTAQWLEHVVAEVPLRRRLLQEEFTALSDTRVPDDLARQILADVYAEPAQPPRDPNEDVMRERMQAWQQRRERVQQRRDVAFNLYQGAGTGMDAPACKGTAYGLLAAVTELEDHSRSHTAATRAESAMFGQRAAVKARVYDILLGLASSL